MAGGYELPRYCGACGDIFDGSVQACPECSAGWPSSLPVDRVQAYAVLLTELGDLWRRREITESNYLVLKRIYESRLIAARPMRRQRAAPLPAAAPAAPVTQMASAAIPSTAGGATATAAAPPPRVLPSPPAPERPYGPPRPPRDTSGDIRRWAAHRQADLVLYLGAFLLSVSALIFVSFGGVGVSGLAKSGLFALYTVAFLVLGMQLRKWKRVQEAGPVFVAIGAILTPLNFVVLYTNVLGNEDIPRSLVWVAGSAASAALYFLLARQGYGKFYLAPGAISVVAGWWSLGVALPFRPEWFGAWFIAPVALIPEVAARKLPKFAGWAQAGALGVGALALGFTHLLMLDELAQHAALPAAYVFAVAGLVLAFISTRRSLPLALLAPAATMFVATATWAVPASEQFALDWAAAWALLCGAGFLGAARLKPATAVNWTFGVYLFGLIAVVIAHIAVFDGEIMYRLPVIYGLAVCLAVAVYVERRYAAALGFVPPLIAMTAASGFWAAETLAFETGGLFIAGVALGYVAFAQWRTKEADLWRGLAVAAGFGALAYGHIAAGTPDPLKWQLSAVYALVALGALADTWRHRESGLVLPFAVAFGGPATLWWLGIGFEAWAFPALGTALAIAATSSYWAREQAYRLFGWPIAVAFSASPIFVVESLLDEPWYGAIAFALGAAALLLATFRSAGAIAQLLGANSERAPKYEQQMLARLAGWALMSAVGFVNLGLELSRIEGAWTFLALALGCWLAVALLRNRVASMDEVLGPLGLTSVAVVVVAAYPDYGQVSLMLGAATVVAAVAVAGRYANAWRIAYGLGAVLTILFGLNEAEFAGTEAWELPAAFGFALVALLIDSVRNRYQPAMLVVPAVTTAGLMAAGWWREIDVVHVGWPPLGVALAIATTERLWSRGALVRRGGWPYVVVLALAPFGVLEPYMDAAWPGALALGLGVVAWGVAAWRSDGAVASIFDMTGERARFHERQVFALGAYGFALASLGHICLALELAQTTGAWVFAAVGVATLLLGWAPLKAIKEQLNPISVGGIVALAIGVAAADGVTGNMAAMMACFGAAMLGLGLLHRSGGRCVLAWATGAVALGLTWDANTWPLWTLGLTYGGIAVAIFAAIAPYRLRWEVMPGAVAVYSQVPMLVALGTGIIAVMARADGLDPEVAIVTTAEWAALAGLVALTGLMVIAEGIWRLGVRFAAGGTGILMAALQMGIAIFEPSNVQAHTVPLAIYIIAAGLAWRSNSPFFGHHMYGNEALIALGALVLLLPPAEQSFAPGGAGWGLVIIAEGLVLLAAGLAITQRWLTVAGVLALVGVAGRFVFATTAGGAVPYWLTLGLVGLALLGVGVLMLLERDWWDRARSRLTHWWLEPVG